MRHFLNDKSLSWQAKGMLAYLLEDNDMYTSIAGDKIYKKSKCGRHVCFKILEELYTSRYLYKKRETDKEGKFSGNHFFIFEVPYTSEDIGLLKT